MTKPYFGDTTTIATTIMILGLVVFIGYTIVNRGSVQHWGMRGLLLLAFGLVVCCFAAARDGLDKTIQSSIDGSCAAGLFPLVSIPTVVGCIGALVIIASAIAMLIANSQRTLLLVYGVRRCREDHGRGNRESYCAASPTDNNMHGKERL